jgi:mono/diheme cytochrome c family protein
VNHNQDLQSGMPWWAPQRKRMVMTAGVLMMLAAGAFGLVYATGESSHEAMVKRGKYLVTIAVCNDCHTPLKDGPNGPEPDMSRMLSGHPSDEKVEPPPATGDFWMASASRTLTAWAGPWGISFTKNLTPDTLTGIGIWTEDMFIAAIRTGRHWGVSRPIMPPMPWMYYRNFTDEDLKSIFAYLQTIPPVYNEVPDYIPPTEVANIN